MTDQVVREEEDEHVPLHRRLFHRARNVVDVDALMLRKYKLTGPERAEMFARGFAYTQFAIPIGSALYFLGFQMQLLYGYPKGNKTYINIYLADGYDRFPAHLENHFAAVLAGLGGLLVAVLVYWAIRKLFRPRHWYTWVALIAVVIFCGIFAGMLVSTPLHHLFPHEHWFPGQGAPPWWVIARHRGRRVMIAFVAIILIGAFMAGLKERERASTEHMIVSVPVAFIAAMFVAGILIALFAWHPVAAGLNQFGLTTNIPMIGDEIAKGAIQSYVIGALAGIAAKKILARTFFTLQVMSIERNVAQGDVITPWKRFLYGATYVKRFNKIRDEVQAKTRVVKLGNRWIGITASLVAPALFILFVVGVWLNYIPGSPAYGVH